LLHGVGRGLDERVACGQAVADGHQAAEAGANLGDGPGAVERQAQRDIGPPPDSSFS